MPGLYASLFCGNAARGAASPKARGIRPPLSRVMSDRGREGDYPPLPARKRKLDSVLASQGKYHFSAPSSEAHPGRVTPVLVAAHRQAHPALVSESDVVVAAAAPALTLERVLLFIQTLSPEEALAVAHAAHCNLVAHFEQNAKPGSAVPCPPSTTLPSPPRECVG